MSKIEIPVFDSREPINQYIRKVERYKNQIIKEKYDLILEFFNMWLNTKYTSLSDFENIYESDLLKDTINNKQIVMSYGEKFGINVKDKINDKYIIYFATKILKTIEYVFSKVKGKEYIYTIKKRD